MAVSEAVILEPVDAFHGATAHRRALHPSEPYGHALQALCGRLSLALDETGDDSLVSFWPRTGEQAVR